MPGYVRVSFTEAGVSTVARMLDDYAPRTCDVVWDALPVEGDVYHSRYSGSDFYILPPALDPNLGSENATQTPIAGDLTYAHVPPDTAGISPGMAEAHPEGLADMCVWYQRDNYHPGDGLNVYARAVEGWPSSPTPAVGSSGRDTPTRRSGSSAPRTSRKTTPSRSCSSDGTCSPVRRPAGK